VKIERRPQQPAPPPPQHTRVGNREVGRPTPMEAIVSDIVVDERGGPAAGTIGRRGGTLSPCAVRGRDLISVSGGVLPDRVPRRPVSILVMGSTLILGRSRD